MGKVLLELVWERYFLSWLIREITRKESTMADHFGKSMPAALKRSTLDELYKRLKDLDYTQVDERLAVMLNAILQLEAQGECREPATEAVLMVGTLQTEYQTRSRPDGCPGLWMEA